MTTPTADGTILVSPDNFTRAESDLYFSNIVSDGTLGTFNHHRELAPVDNQLVVRLNRDTLYSVAVFDLDAAPVTITLPDPGRRFMSMQIITEDQYVPAVVYGAGSHTFTREDIGTRCVATAIRTLVDPNDPADLATVHQLQDAITVHQDSPGTFEIPRWDTASQTQARNALLQLAATLPDTKGMFGSKDNTDPVRRLIGSASACGGDPEHDALYLNVTPSKNDGTTAYRLAVGEVPVDGFWSVTVYDAQRYLTPSSRMRTRSTAQLWRGTLTVGLSSSSVTAPRTPQTVCRSRPAGTTWCASTDPASRSSTAAGSSPRPPLPSDREQRGQKRRRIR